MMKDPFKNLDNGTGALQVCSSELDESSAGFESFACQAWCVGVLAIRCLRRFWSRSS